MRGGYDSKIIWRISAAMSRWVKTRQFPKFFTLTSKREIKGGYELLLCLNEEIGRERFPLKEILFRIYSDWEDIVDLGKRLLLYRFEIKTTTAGVSSSCSGRAFRDKTRTNCEVGFIRLEQLHANLAKFFEESG